MATISLRAATDADHPLILDSFWREYRRSRHAEGVPASWLRTLLDPLLRSWRSAVAVADGELLGWICWRDSHTVAWVQVKSTVRERGVALALLEHAGIGRGEIECPFLPTGTPAIRNFPKLAATKGYTLRFRPYLPFAVAGEATEVAA